MIRKIKNVYEFQILDKCWHFIENSGGIREDFENFRHEKQKKFYIDQN